MKSIGTRFSVTIGGFAILFSVIVLYQAWRSSTRHASDLTSHQAKLALEFDLAIREYVGESIRPEMEQRIGEDEFILPVMSTSYVAREIAEKVRKNFPTYLLKFPSDNPRNPNNKARIEEERFLQRFRQDPQMERWDGLLEIDGKQYYACMKPMRVEPVCLRCHGRPEQSPKSLLDRYGSTGGFYRQVGDVAGMDMIAIPMETVHLTLASQARSNLLISAVWLAVLFASIFVAFRLIVRAGCQRSHNTFNWRLSVPKNWPRHHSWRGVTTRSVFWRGASTFWRRRSGRSTSRWRIGCGNGPLSWPRPMSS